MKKETLSNKPLRLLTSFSLAVVAFTMLFFAALAVMVGTNAPVAHAADTGSQTMYRLYNPNSGEHFYTARVAEKENLTNAGWVYEGYGWIAPRSSNTPVYRLYSGTDHHYTKDPNERKSLEKAGWKYEGIGWYSSDSNKSYPLYRQFNPNVNPKAKRGNAGSHNYTTSKGENDSLVRCGWRGEGIGWYAIGGGTPVASHEHSWTPASGTKYVYVCCDGTTFASNVDASAYEAELGDANPTVSHSNRHVSLSSRSASYRCEVCGARK